MRDIECHYWRLHIPSGTRTFDVRRFEHKCAFYRELAMWNARAPGQWQYWEKHDHA